MRYRIKKEEFPGGIFFEAQYKPHWWSFWERMPWYNDTAKRGDSGMRTLASQQDAVKYHKGYILDRKALKKDLKKWKREIKYYHD